MKKHLLKLTTLGNLLTLWVLSSNLSPIFAGPISDPNPDPEPNGGTTGLPNPAIDTKLGALPDQASAGLTFSYYLVLIWRGLISFAAVFLIIYMIWGAIRWLGAGGDSSKVQQARDIMTNGIIGFIILIGSFVIIQYIGQLIGFDLLRLSFPAASEAP